jgi:hypothetical protein
LTSISLLPIFVVGLLGGVHCVGMCGGIVSAFAVAMPRRPFPVAVTAAGGLPAVVADSGARVLAFNAGRLGSYAIAGALAGLIGSVPAMIQIASLQTAAYWLANLMLVALGLSLMNVWHGLSRVEAVGQIVWRRVQPLMRTLVPVQHPLQAFALGGLWGWVPCGMVYSVLMTALLSSSAWQGALVMLAFGLGTLPLLLTMGVVGTSVQALLQRRALRLVAGLLVLAFGCLGLLRVGMGLSHGWLDSLCITPVAY